jgi:hypothetical protein
MFLYLIIHRKISLKEKSLVMIIDYLYTEHHSMIFVHYIVELKGDKENEI